MRQTRPVKQIPFTKDGLIKIKQKYEDLLKKRPEAVKNLSTARNMGDLSENGLYKAARSNLTSIDADLRRLKNTIKLAVVEETKQKNVAGIGSSVTIFDGKSEKTYKIVGPFEADPKQNKISINSPIGRSLLDRKTGETVEFYTPSGKNALKITNIS